MKSAFALSWFEALITSELGKVAVTGQHWTADETASLVEQAEKQKEHTRKLLLHQVFSMKDERMLEALIQQYQAALIRLITQLESYTYWTVHLPPHVQQLCAQLREHLGELLQFIESYFTKYLDLDAAVPTPYLVRKQQAWQEQLDQNRSRWTAAVKALFSGLLMPVLQEAIKVKKLHFRQLNYFQHLFQAIAASEERGEKNAPFAPLEETLMYLNFNHPLFIAYIIRNISAVTESLQKEAAVREHLLACKDAVSLVRPKPGAAYREQLPPVHTSIHEWIDFQLNPTTDNTKYMTQPAQDGKKVNLSVSVAMLGLFVRILHEEGVITTKNQADLNRFFVSHFATPRQQEISADSLYGSYYKPQPGTVRMMQECLLRMHHTLTKKF